MRVEESLLIAEEEIKPFLTIFKECYAQAIIKYNDCLNFFAEPIYNRTKAIQFQNIIVNRVKQAFSGMDNVIIIEKYESISLVINNYISARFKKFNGNGLPSNHRSKRNDAIIAQQLELGFLDYPPIARIDVGYAMDVTGTNYELLKVICRKNNEILWDLYFNDTNEGESNNDIVIKGTPTTPTPNEGQRIKINKEHKKAKE